MTQHPRTLNKDLLWLATCQALHWGPEQTRSLPPEATPQVYGNTGVSQTMAHTDWVLTGGRSTLCGCRQGFDLGREAVHLSCELKFPRCQGVQKSGSMSPGEGQGPLAGRSV